MHVLETLSAEAALARLMEGNRQFQQSEQETGDISFALRRRLADHGQAPYAIVITCSDARVPPEYIFSAALGDLFVIRVAGNVMDDHQLGSVEYAAEHLQCRLVLVLGHTGCGAVEAALTGDPEGYIKFITDEVRAAVGDETDRRAACEKNVRRSIKSMEQSASIQQLEQHDGLRIVGGIYDLVTGGVSLLD